MKIKAFSLLELSIVIAVMGILSYFFLPAYQNIQNLNKIKKTQNNIQIIEKAILGYLIVNKRLPFACNNLNGTQEEGLTVGILPFKSLNIDENIAKDGNNNFFTYCVNKNLCSDFLEIFKPKDSILSNNKFFDKITLSKNPQITDSNSTSLTEQKSLAYVIISHGINGGYYNQNLQISSINNNNPLKINNAKRSGIFIKEKQSKEFDDIIHFISRDLLLGYILKN